MGARSCCYYSSVMGAGFVYGPVCGAAEDCEKLYHVWYGTAHEIARAAARVKQAPWAARGATIHASNKGMWGVAGDMDPRNS